MRSNHNPSVSTNRSVGSKLRMPLSGMPMEWLDAGSWRLPSGKALAEFALQAGFLAPLLFRAERFGRSPGNAPRALDGASQERSKSFGKGGSH